MKKRAALFLLLGPLLGLLAGWASVPRTGQGGGGEAADRRRAASHSSRPVWTTDDLLRHLRDQERDSRSSPPPNPLAETLRGWTDAEVRAALEESLRDPELLLGYTSLTSLIFQEYLQRDFAAATAFFGNLPADTRALLAGVLTTHWPADHAAEGLDFLRKNRALLSAQVSPSHIIALNLTAAAAGGVGDLTTLMRQLKSEGFSVDPGKGVTFPPGFDFPALLASGDGRPTPNPFSGGSNGVITRWVQQDREAAFRWVLENQGAKDLGLIDSQWWEGPPDLLPWFQRKLESLAPAQRAELLTAKQRTWQLSPTSAMPTLEAAKGSPIHGEILTRAAQGIFSGKSGECLPMIEQLPDPEARLHFIETLQPLPTETAGTSSSSSTTGMDETSETFLRKKLLEWQAAPDRIEAIVTHLKGARP